MSDSRRPRLLVLIVGGGPAEPDRLAAAVQAALSRIPGSIIQAFEIEGLIITDGPERPAPSAALPFPLTLLGNPAPQGYGGIQKIGFHYAIDRGFDFVVLLHGDGKYAAECLPKLLEPLAEGRADAAYGSRMLNLAAARGGMPLYKFAGNRILSALQSRLLRTPLSEFHSGYRAYMTAALKRIPFHLNSDEFHFDTEITIQLLLSGARIVEVPIPAYNSTEIGPANGLTYAARVIGTCVKARAQELSLFFDRRFDCVPSTVSNVHYKPRLGFTSTHTIALDSIPARSRVLDIGCAGGYFGQILRDRGCHTTGVDKFPLVPPNTLDAFHLHDLNQAPLPVDLATFDYAVMLDVLEHLQSPETFIDDFRTAAGRNPDLTLLISTPNVAFIVVRLMLLVGKFNYGKRGILDLTHTRLFTFSTFRRLFEQSGYEVISIRGVPAPFPLALGDNWFARLLLAANSVLIKLSRRLFAFQIFAVVRPKPGLPYLLDRAVVRTAR